MKLILKLLINALAIYISAQVIEAIQLQDLQSAILVAVILSVVNTFIRPILLFFTLPLNIMTLGLFTFIINALMIILTSYIVTGFTVPTFVDALFFSVLVSLVSTVLTWIAK